MTIPKASAILHTEDPETTTKTQSTLVLYTPNRGAWKKHLSGYALLLMAVSCHRLDESGQIWTSQPEDPRKLQGRIESDRHVQF